MGEAKGGHEWITFQRSGAYSEDHGEPIEVTARWCANCGTLDLGDSDTAVGRFFTIHGVRQGEPPCRKGEPQ